MTSRTHGAVLFVAACLLTACAGSSDEARTPAPTTVQSSPCVAPATGNPRPAIDVVVTVYLACGIGDADGNPDLRPVKRLVYDDGQPLRAALNQLLLGTVEQERDAGFRSAFTEFTAAALQGVVVRDGIATLSFSNAIDLQNNISTDGVSRIAWPQLTKTVFEFPEVRAIELRVDGARWCGWNNTCDGLPVPMIAREATTSTSA